MAKRKLETKEEKNPITENTTLELNIVLDHYTRATADMDQRRLRHNGWNDVLNAYHNKLPKDWPYLSEVTEPIIRTTIIEKTARLFNGKLRGKVVPREGGDNIKAKLQNALISYQWDNANDGGSMLEKWVMMDVQTRLFGASFGLTHWCEKDNYYGNEFKVLDPRDVLIDPSATHIRNANWIQVREWKLLDDLIEENERAKESGGQELYPNLQKLIDAVNTKGGDNKSMVYESHMKDLRGLEDQSGQDEAFPIVELVTEYRKGKLIKFSPKYNIIISSFDNPLKSKRIPIVMLRYYPVPDDIYGEAEVESVMPIAHAINAMWSGAVDEANLTMNPPIKIAHSDGTVRTDTVVYGPNAQWLVGSNPNNVVEHQPSQAFISNLQTVYTALKGAFNSAMGETSMGVSNIEPTQQDKTATEVKALERQKLSRDQYNQLYLEQALKDQTMLWITNNQQFLFSDPNKQEYILRVVGKDLLKDLQQLELDQTTQDPQAIQMVADEMLNRGGNMDDYELQQLMSMTDVPKYPVVSGGEVKAKLEMDEGNEYGTLTMVPDDLEGVYDFIPDVQSMALGADKETKDGRNMALELALRPEIKQGLMEEGFALQMKDLVVSVLEDKGYKDAEKFIKQINEQPVAGQINGTGNPTVAQLTGLSPINGAQSMGNGGQPVSGNMQQGVPQPQGQAI